MVVVIGTNFLHCFRTLDGEISGVWWTQFGSIDGSLSHMLCILYNSRGCCCTTSIIFSSPSWLHEVTVSTIEWLNLYQREWWLSTFFGGLVCSLLSCLRLATAIMMILQGMFSRTLYDELVGWLLFPVLLPGAIYVPWLWGDSGSCWQEICSQERCRLA